MSEPKRHSDAVPVLAALTIAGVVFGGIALATGHKDSVTVQGVTFAVNDRGWAGDDIWPTVTAGNKTVTDVRLVDAKTGKAVGSTPESGSDADWYASYDDIAKAPDGVRLGACVAGKTVFSDQAIKVDAKGNLDVAVVGVEGLIKSSITSMPAPFDLC